VEVNIQASTGTQWPELNTAAVLDKRNLPQNSPSTFMKHECLLTGSRWIRYREIPIICNHLFRLTWFRESSPSERCVGRPRGVRLQCCVEEQSSQKLGTLADQVATVLTFGWQAATRQSCCCHCSYRQRSQQRARLQILTSNLAVPCPTPRPLAMSIFSHCNSSYQP
jgi:hypothetical protein